MLLELGSGQGHGLAAANEGVLVEGDPAQCGDGGDGGKGDRGGASEGDDREHTSGNGEPMAVQKR